MRLELTRVGLLVELANHYTTGQSSSKELSTLVADRVKNVNKRTLLLLLLLLLLHKYLKNYLSQRGTLVGRAV